MRTPDGRECRHYYQDFHRGRDIQECRLVNDNLESERWNPNDCSKCPVPQILQANACRHLQLKLTIKSHLFGLSRRLTVDANCSEHHLHVEDPHIGCGNCNNNPGLDIFRQALEDIDD